MKDKKKIVQSQTWYRSMLAQLIPQIAQCQYNDPLLQVAQAENTAGCSAGALPGNSHGSCGEGGGGGVAVEGSVRWALAVMLVKRVDVCERL